MYIHHVRILLAIYSEATACMRQLMCTAVSQLSSDQLVPLHHHALFMYPACLFFLIHHKIDMQGTCRFVICQLLHHCVNASLLLYTLQAATDMRRMCDCRAEIDLQPPAAPLCNQAKSSGKSSGK
jgi:hypothetical protein